MRIWFNEDLESKPLEEQKQIIKEHPHKIRSLRYQDPELVKLAVETNPHVLSLVRNQTEELCILAVKQKYYVISHVRNLTDAVIRAAIETDDHAVYYLPEALFLKYTEEYKEWKNI